MDRARDRRDRHGVTQFDLLALLCGDARAGLRTDRIVRAAAELSDWDGFMDLVTRHRVVGIAHTSASRCPEAFPPLVRDALATEAATLAMRNVAIAAETAQLQRLFDEAEIVAVFFKGVTLAKRAYGTFLTKQSKDIDFLVPPAELSKAVALLERRGYRMDSPWRNLTPAQWRSVQTFGMEVQMVNAGTQIAIEPHWRLVKSRQMLSSAVVNAAAKTAGDEIAGNAIRALQPDDLFAYLCVHGTACGWFRLKWLADLNALILEASPEELERLHRHAESRGAGASSALALSMCAAVFDRAVPAAILARVDGLWSLRQLKALCLGCLEVETVSLWRSFSISLLQASAEGCLLIELDSWTIGLSDAIKFPLPRPLHFLYRIIRLPSWLLRRLRR